MSGIMQERAREGGVLSSGRRRRLASALVKTVLLGEEKERPILKEGRVWCVLGIDHDQAISITYRRN